MLCYLSAAKAHHPSLRASAFPVCKEQAQLTFRPLSLPGWIVLLRRKFRHIYTEVPVVRVASYEDRRRYILYCSFNVQSYRGRAIARGRRADPCCLTPLKHPNGCLA